MRLLLAVTGALTVAMTTVAAAPAPAAAAPVTKRLAVVVIQNGDTDNERTQLADTTFLRNIFFGTSNSLATWMPAVSHGLLSYVPAADGLYLAQPTDALLNADKTKCHSDLARTAAEQHLATRGVAWESLAVVFDIYGCTWGGLGQMPGRVTWFPPRPSLSAVVHEFGHNQGYPHQSKRDCTGGNVSSCRANDYSGNTPMGSGGSGRGYSSVELLHSGWVEPSWLQRVSSPGTFTLKPLHAPVSVTGVRVVEYKVSTSLSYVIETRAQGSPIDTAITNPGVRVYAVAKGDYRNAYMVNPGARYVPTSTTLTDAASKLTITVRSASASGATVAVAAIAASPTRSSAAARSAAPSATPAETTPSPPPSPETEPSPIDTEGVVTDIAADEPAQKGGGWVYVLLATGVALALALASATTMLMRRRHRPRHRA